MTKIRELTSNPGADCGHGDLVAPGAYGALSEPPNGGYVDDDGASVKWHWLKPIPKLHL